MPSTTALFTGLSGLSVNARQLDVIGNNIANVNTTGYKSNRMLFAPTFSRTFSSGTSPDTFTGGTNPLQVGNGATIGATQRNMNTGSITATGVPTDVAIEGDGFFITEFGQQRLYTRVGSFVRNETNDLVTLAGARVMGFPVDGNFQVTQGSIVPLNVPVGTLTLAEATRNVNFNGNLNASGDIAGTGSIHEARAFFTDAGLTIPATDALDLTVAGNDLYIDDGAGGSLLAFEGGSGAVITLGGVQKGGKDLGTMNFTFSAAPVPGADANGTTLADYVTFLNDVLGLDSSVIGGQSLGGLVSFDNATGVLTITGNEGTAQNLTLQSANFIATNAGAGINQPFVFNKTQDADGESVRTSFVVYDSLGSPLTVDLTFVLQQTTPGSGTTWEFIAESSDNDALDRIVGLGTVSFDGNGNFVSASNDTFSMARANGAVSPLIVQMAFSTGTDQVSAFTSTTSNLAATFQDGSALGTLAAFSITGTGLLEGSFTNGLTRTIGQIAMAKFSNNEGLIDSGGGNYLEGPNSGAAIITQALDFGTGRMIGGALELSNVDLSAEFINMILASTGYSASSRVITTTDELIDQLLLIGR